MKIIKNEWLQILILAVSFSAVALLWDKLPAQMPTRWDGNSHPGNFRPSNAALFPPTATNSSTPSIPTGRGRLLASRSSARNGKSPAMKSAVLTCWRSGGPFKKR